MWCGLGIGIHCKSLFISYIPSSFKINKHATNIVIEKIQFCSVAFSMTQSASQLEVGKYQKHSTLPIWSKVVQHSIRELNLHATSFLKKRGILHRKPPLDLKDRCLLQPAMKFIAY